MDTMKYYKKFVRLIALIAILPLSLVVALFNTTVAVFRSYVSLIVDVFIYADITD